MDAHHSGEVRCPGKRRDLAFSLSQDGGERKLAVGGGALTPEP